MQASTQHSITLIRHGPPAVSLRQKVRGHQFRQFVERYDAAKITQRALPPLAVRQVVSQADYVFASSRPRAMHTAELLGVIAPPVVDPQFREIEFPVDFPRYLRFSALVWSVIALLLWRMGYSSRSESLARARARAYAAADLLESYLKGPLPGCSEGRGEGRDEGRGAVVLVAHAGINRLIAKELRKRGWRGPRMPRSQHWGCTTYCR
ncbi:MAG: histidine phosphatase family protein [Phormidesmis sp.]